MKCEECEKLKAKLKSMSQTLIAIIESDEKLAWAREAAKEVRKSKDIGAGHA